MGKLGCLSGNQNLPWVCYLHRSALENSLDLATLSEEKKHLLLAALIQGYGQEKARKLEQKEQKAEDSR